MQLNFLNGYDDGVILSSEIPIQAEFWNLLLEPVTKTRKAPRCEEIAEFFNKLDYNLVSAYTDYWEVVSPKNDTEVFQRWLFAFMSVHTSWKNNIVGYLAIKDWWQWMNRWELLLERINSSRVGMQNNRVRYISEFANKFWKNPSVYRKYNDETWTECRDRLEDITLGLGMAKTSFALEMCYPLNAMLICLDTHMFQAYKLEQTKDRRHYKNIEAHWVDMCRMWRIPPYIARCIYWDTKQKYSDSRYWSHVLEKNN